jgi:hypothetical protein
MSVGNLPTQGDKKSNWTWQFAVVELLGQIASGAGGAGIVRTPTILRASAPGTITAGKKSVSVFNAGAISGTVLGALLKPGELITYSVPSPADTLPVIAYDATGTDLLITTLV